MREKNILLLGGGGFIGTALARRLCENNFNVHILSRHFPAREIAPNMIFHRATWTTEKFLSRCCRNARPSFILHLPPLRAVPQDNPRWKQIKISPRRFVFWIFSKVTKIFTSSSFLREEHFTEIRNLHLWMKPIRLIPSPFTVPERWQ